MGRLYTWYTVADSRGICPIGWHVPTDAEWTILTDFLTNNKYSQTIYKNDIAESMASNSLWSSYGIYGTVGSDLSSNNQSGLSVPPAGSRNIEISVGGQKSEYFTDIYNSASLWSSTELLDFNAWYRQIQHNSSTVYRGTNDKLIGYSVRFISGEVLNVSIVNREEIYFYPNPAKDKLYLKNDNYLNGDVMIFDLDGKLEMSKKIDSNNIDVSMLKKGIYIVKLSNSNNVLVNKLIKE